MARKDRPGNVELVEMPRIGLTEKTGTVSSSGDNTIVAAPGEGKQIVVTEIVLQLEGDTATTAILKSGSTAKKRVYMPNAGDGVALTYHPAFAWALGENEALVLNLSGANQVGYTFSYYIEVA